MKRCGPPLDHANQVERAQMLGNKSSWLAALLMGLSACGQLDGADGQKTDGAEIKRVAATESQDASALSAIGILRQRLETPRANDVMVIAHRSCWHEAPENSLAAMKACIAMGVDMIEVDVRVSADGALVVMHDETVDRTTNGSGRVDELTLEEIKALSLKEGEGGPDAPLTEYKVPTLDEVFAAVRGKILVNLDTKGEVLRRAMAAVTEAGLGKQILFKSSLGPNDPVLREMALPANSYFMPVVRESAGTLADHVAAFQWAGPAAFEVVFQSDGYLETGAKAVTGTGVRLWVNTLWDGLAGNHTDAAALLDPNAHWGYVISQGVTMIQTDQPRALLAYLKSRDLR